VKPTVKAIAAVGFVVAVGMGVLEVVMHPDRTGRLEALTLFVAMAVLTLAAAYFVPAIGTRTRSLGHTVAAVGLVAAGLISLAVAAGAWRMFLSVHDLHLLGVMLAVAAGLSVVFALSVTSSLRHDLDALRRTSDQVANGDLAARTGVSRGDELGATADALDAMVGRLADADEARRRDDDARRALLAAIGHDLRTPLAALQAAIEALQDGLAPDPDRYLRSMSHDVAHLKGLVDDLFLLARIEAGELTLERQHVDLAELADETIEAMEPTAQLQQVDLRLEATGSVPVLGGPEALGRVMRNLVDNAIRHAPASSCVVLRVANRDGATVEVIDQGPGFDPALVTSAFDSFSRADPSRNRDTGGAGLGLAIAKGVVEAHGGHVGVSSVAGQGSTFSVSLPMAPSRG
jgi:signal transduction histidine kinase